MKMGEREIRLRDFINKKLDTPLGLGSLELRTRKSQVGVRDIDLFHEIAQALKLNELKMHGGVHSILKIPGDSRGDYWTLKIAGDGNSQAFLEKYGSEYQLI